MVWENLQKDILEDIVGLQQHWEDDYNFDFVKQITQVRALKNQALSSNYAWRQKSNPETRAVLRAKQKANREAIKSDPEKLEALRKYRREWNREKRKNDKEYAERERAMARERRRRKNEQGPSEREKVRARQKAWRESMTPERREEYLRKRREQERARKARLKNQKQL